jgi:uncharacterized protein (TIGR03382 family)
MKSLSTSILRTGTLAAATLLAIPAAHAALIVYEGFNYGLADNAALGNSFGWQSSAGSTGTTSWQFDTTSLAVPFTGATGATLPAATGGSLQLAGGGQTGFDTPAWGTLSTSSTYWYSFTLNTYGGTVGDPGSYTSSPRGTFNIFTNTINANNPQNGFGINISNGGVLSAGSSTGGAATTGITIATGGVYSILGRLVVDGSGGATNTVWANPTDVSSVAALGTGASTTGSIVTNEVAASFGGRSFGGSTGYRIDEIRVGTELMNVVPEPSAAALGLIGLAGLLRRRR